MKSKDLMIGDWVNLSKGNWSKNRQVELIDIEMIAESVYLAEPIPLTPEILEKNGFKQIGCHWYHDENEFYELEVYEYTDSIWRCVYRSKEMNIGDSRVFVCHVHELQHALRLCGGVNKTIEL